MSTYLISGIAGFIGSSLARALLEQGEQVRGIDNFSTGKPENISEIQDQIDFREADLLELEATRHACRDVDYVLHHAAIPSVPRTIDNPLETNRSSVDATVNLLVAARDAKVRRVVYAASSSAYGDTPTLPKTEDMAPMPISPYAVGKLAGEHYMTGKIHRLSVYGVSRGEKASATTNSGGADWVREVRAEDEAGAVSRGDGAGGAVGRVTGVGGTALSEGRQRAACGRTEHHVAGVFSAAVVQLERSGRGGCAL